MKTTIQLNGVKIIFALFAFICVMTGFAIYILSDFLNIAPETSWFLSIAFIIIGLADAFLLFIWDHIFRSSNKQKMNN